MLDHVVIVMPAYNAGATIERVFAAIPAAVRSRVRHYVVVDDGSTDETPAALARLRAALPRLETLTHPANRGYGAAEKTLLKRAVELQADAVVLLHADGQYAPECIPRLLVPLDAGAADLVQGSRMLGGGALRGGMPRYKYLANRALTFLENRVLGLRLAEYHSGFMVYSGRLLHRVPFERLSDTFEFDLEMMVAAHILGMRIAEVPIPTIYADEVSHLDPIRYGLDVLAVMRRYRRGAYHALMGAAGTPCNTLDPEG